MPCPLRMPAGHPSGNASDGCARVPHPSTRTGGLRGVVVEPPFTADPRSLADTPDRFPRCHARPSLTISSLCLLLDGMLLPGVAVAQDPARVGKVDRPFVEPTIDGRSTEQKRIEGADAKFPRCKPAAGSIALLRDHRLLYHNALENTEGVRHSIIAEYGQTSSNDQSRLLDLSGRTPEWRKPEPVRADTATAPVDTEPLLPSGLLNDAEQAEFACNDQALLCSDSNLLPDGRLLFTGETNYYTGPQIPGTDKGALEVEGLEQTRIFDPSPPVDGR